MTAEPSARRRMLGRALRRYRENLGLAIDDAARVLDCDRSKISRIETGQRGIRPGELRELLTGYGVADSEQAVLARLAGRTQVRGWQDQYPGTAPGSLADYLIMEAAAAQIMTYDPCSVPGLLQAPDYARAAAGAQADPRPGDAAAAATARREAFLSGTGSLSAVIGEAALHQEAGGPHVMAAQLEHLIELAGAQPRITVQVLPFTAGAHPAISSGPHTILRFPHAPGLGIVCLPTLTGATCLDSPADLDRYASAFTMLRDAALTPEDTTRLLRDAIARRPPWD